MQSLAFMVAGPWEIAILLCCGMGFILVVAAVIVLAVYLSRKKAQGSAGPQPGPTPPGSPPSPPAGA